MIKLLVTCCIFSGCSVGLGELKVKDFNFTFDPIGSLKVIVPAVTEKTTTETMVRKS